jgi:predicted lipid-binding transport protein (Tim44 family)
MKGHAILGGISGFFFGLFLGISLFLFGAVSLDSDLLWILPLVGIVLGLVMAALAPFGSGGQPPAATAGGAAGTGTATASGTTIEQDVVTPQADTTPDQPPDTDGEQPNTDA